MGQPTVQQTELLACKQILEFAKTFYLNPDNLRAFEAWMKFKEEKRNGTNQDRSHLQH